MEEYLRRVHSRLGADVSEGPVHAVLGGPRPDVDTVAATLCLALHLSQKEPSGGLCLPVLCGRRCNAALPEDTVKYLQRVNICESLLLWREDVDLVTLHYTGKLSLTLLRDGLLDSSEYLALESSILRVVHHDGQQDTGDDGASFAVTTVAREIRQEAAEHIRAALGKTLGEALRLQNEALLIKHGRQSTQLEELRRSLEQLSDVDTNQSDLEQLLTTELKGFSDGEMTLALSSLTTDQEVASALLQSVGAGCLQSADRVQHVFFFVLGNWVKPQHWPSYVGGLKSFSQSHDLDCLVVLLSSNDTVHHLCQQVAVYSNDTDILNQICCELEDSSSWSLSRELEARENLQVYHIPINTSPSSSTPPLLEEEIQSFLKDFVDRRSSVLACHPSSRTSSTEGVAGSVEFSQGSSGINDMDTSDIERAEGGSADVVAIARVMTDGEEDTGGVGVSAGGELVSPDSGLTTIRSSRSSKESSVFLSDDSPVGEIIAGGGPAAGPGGLLLRNPSPLGLSSLSPPVPLERRKHRAGRNKTDNFDLFSFDPLQSNDPSLSAGGELSNSQVRGDGGLKGQAGSSNLSELEELSFLDFSSDSRNSSIDHHGQNHGNEIMDTVVPPTPVNSLAGSCPPNSCAIRFFPEDVAERINGLQRKDSMSSSLSETWDELCFDTQGALSSSDNIASNRTKEYESPQNIVEDVGFKESITERESREEILKNPQQRPKTLQPQLSLVSGQTDSNENWNTDSVLKELWNPVTLADLQLTPPEEEGTGKWKAGIIGAREKTKSVSRKKAILNMLTPDTSKEEDERVQGKKDDRKMELLDFWTYSAQKGFLKSDSGTTTSYPESLDMWNMTIRDDSLSPLTTPDNLSENSGSFCGVNPSVVGGTSVESPPGFCNGGMEMWNTTIQEDSSSTVTSPEGPDNGKELSHMGSPDASDSPETCAGKESEEEKAIEVGNDVRKVISHTPEKVEWGGNEHNVRIVIEAAESRAQGEETGEDDMQNLASEHSEKETSPHPDTNMWDLPVPGMVNSTSEYDNVGAGQWSQTSSPETYASPVMDIIQLEGQSSPFIALTKPIQLDETLDESKTAITLGKTESRAVISVKEHPVSQVFLFEGTSGGSSLESEYDNKGKGGSIEADWVEQPSDYSPFVLVDYSSATYRSSRGEAAETQILTEQSQSSSHVNWDSSESASLSNALSITEDRTANEIQRGSNKENGDVESKIISSSSSGKRDTLKCSPDSLHSGSRDEARSNSDGDSSSGLEMECIVVSGTVKEAEREWHDRPKQGDKQTKGTSKFMETFSTLFHAATVLQTQVQGAHKEHQEKTEQKGQSQKSADMEQNQAVLPTYHDLDNITHHLVSETFSPSQSKVISEAFHQSHSRPKVYSQTQVEDDKSSTVARSVSPSLRYPSDNFLKAREEVYVHSQISMEDSDEGGQSPSAPPLCPTSLGDFQDWGGQLVRQDTPQAPSEIQSPVLSNSSVSHPSSLAGTPFSESGISTDRGLGLPFSGDLMEEENDEEEQEEETDMEHTTLTKSTPEVQNEREEKQLLGSCDLLSFTEELSRGSSFGQTDFQTLEMKQGRFPQDTVDCYNGQPVRTVDHDECLSDQQTGSHEASQDGYSLVSRRHQDVTSPLPSQPANENAAYQWTGSHDESQGQTQYGYNYHHIDQRTEIQNTHSTCVETKSNSQWNTTAVYAEFTTDPAAIQCGSDQAESYYETGVNAEYTPDDSKYQYMAENQYGDEASQLQCSQYQTDGQCQYEMDHAQYQLEGQPFYQSDVQPEREDHARYVQEGYVHSLLSRHSQQRDSAAGMMMKMASSEEAAEELDNREDPASSADVSGSSNQRRKLAAPPLNVSLDHSEGSLLSEDALDTEDEALDTGDDLDINIDELDTPDEADSLELTRHGDSVDSDLGAGVASSDVTTGHSSAEGSRDSRLWRSVVIGEQEHRIDMKSIEPYKRVISHGGYYAEQNAIIVFAACFLPDSDCDNYSYVMENLFLYVISTLELMVAEDYMIVYLNGATPRRRMPGFSWMKKCYQMIDRRLKKNLKMFIIVHPSWFIRTLLGITRPFISSKFSSKIKYVNSLRELGEIIPMEYVHIPPSIVKLDTDLQETAAKADKKGNSAI